MFEEDKRDMRETYGFIRKSQMLLRTGQCELFYKEIKLIYLFFLYFSIDE
jgi:hypothetical protein